ncbi:MAG: oligopeptide ABC transporter permease [Spirochaetota bacterium]
MRLFQENSFYDLAYRRFIRNKLAIIGAAVTLIFVFIAIFAPVLTPYGPSEFFFAEGGATYNRYAPPSAEHLLGTDRLGRDVLTRVLYGARVTIVVAFAAVLISTVIGTIVGLISGYFGKLLDSVLMRIVDVVISFPVLFLLISISTILEPSLWIVVFAIGFVRWTNTARLVRGEVLRIKQLDFISAARGCGSLSPKIIAKHIMPNILAPVMVQVTIGTAQAILMEASLSFLGVGVQQPTPSWGNMLIDAQRSLVLRDMPWVWLPPGMVTLLLVLGIYFLGDGLRDAFDPKQ